MEQAEMPASTVTSPEGFMENTNIQEAINGAHITNDTKDGNPANITNSTMSGSVRFASTSPGPIKRKRMPSLVAEKEKILRQISTHPVQPESKKAKIFEFGNAVKSVPLLLNTDNIYGLPKPIWEHVLTFLPPAALGSLLRVSRFFNAILFTHPDDLLTSKSSESSRGLRTSENIWQQSHIRFTPGLPFPFSEQTELSMWRMIKGRRCQMCGCQKPLKTTFTSQNAWAAGPGDESVRVIWPFLARLCGQCLRHESISDRDLLLSSSIPSFLSENLPYVFISNTNDCFTGKLLQQDSVTQDARPVKIFLKSQVEALKNEYELLKGSSLDTLAPWIDSLSRKRLTWEQDTFRWESWEKKGILAKINSKTEAFKHPRPRKDDSSAEPQQKAVQEYPSRTEPSRNTSIDKEPINSIINVSENFRKQALATPVELFQMNNLGSSSIGHQQRLYRGFEGAQIARASRRDEIIRRSALLEPPINVDLLEQMQAFHAALQIAKELDNQQWGILEERLQSERSEAEARLKVITLKQNGSVEPLAEVSKDTGNETMPSNSQSVTFRLPGVSEKRTGGFQFERSTPHVNNNEVHSELRQIANEIIDERWNRGRSLDKDSCSQFAAEILVHARKVFYAGVPQSPRDGGRSKRVLLLDDMRWLFETCIKPSTEQHQKEIFLCNRCENASKTYGFEAVVQHYAAKHTSRLSLGSVVVHWRSEWPEEPPFHPNPMLVRALAITASTSNHYNSQLQSRSEAHKQSLRDFQKFAPSTRPLGYASMNMSGVQPSQNLMSYSSANKNSQTRSNQYSYSSSEAIAKFTPAMVLQRAKSDYSLANEVDDRMHRSAIDAQYQSLVPKNVVSYSGHTTEPQFPNTETFQAHQAEMAKYAREIWFATAGLKGLPGCVRIQVIIHHACERFVRKFQLEPGVNMFLFALNHESAMRPLRALTGFSCQACVAGRPGALPYTKRKQSSTLPHLLTHFMASHAEYNGLDWRKDMVQLPQIHVITGLINSVGINDLKFSLLASAFPNAFPRPLPSLYTLQQQTSWLRNDSATETAAPLQQAFLDSSNEESSSSPGYSGIMPLAANTSNDGLVGENEYDPRRPSYIGKFIDGYHGQNLNNEAYSVVPDVKITRSEAGEADRFLENLSPGVYTGRYREEHQTTPMIFAQPFQERARPREQQTYLSQKIWPADAHYSTARFQAQLVGDFTEDYHITNHYEPHLDRRIRRLDNARDASLYNQFSDDLLPTKTTDQKFLYRNEEGAEK